MFALYANKGNLANTDRKTVINDVKLFAQADIETEIEGYVTSDAESKKMYDIINTTKKVSFSFIDIKTPCHEVYSFLPLK